MPRHRLSSVRKHITPTRLQDGTGLENRIRLTFIDDFFAPLEIRVETLEALLDALTALGRFSMATATVELKKGRTGGTSYIEPEDAFDTLAVGRPVIVNQAPNGDADEHGIVQFTGEVISRSRIRLRWHAAKGAPKSVPVVYLIA